jgi:IrrE N-terminal-like domain
LRIKAETLSFFLTDSAGLGRSTTRALRIAIDDEPAWPMAGLTEAAVEIQVDDLLAFLAEHWKPLLLRQTFPAPFNPYLPSQLRADASTRWNEVPAETAEREEEAVLGFEEAHDLSRAFAGLFDLPPIWLLRSGETYHVESQGRLWVLPYDQVVGALTQLGNSVAELLRHAGDKWAPLLNAWDRRTEGDGAGLLAWAIGLTLDDSRILIQQGMLEEPANFSEAANDNDELRIAARMAGALPVDQIREILVLARSYGKNESEELDELAYVCSREVSERWSARPPYVQGEVAAGFARNWLDIGPDLPCDVLAVLEHLNVSVRADDVEPESLDALAIWGLKHGPGVFLNLASQRVSMVEPKSAGEDPALRVTLAHELCHLLLDGDHTVTAVDVLRSRMPVSIEQRAKSFAGELLLPSRSAARWWQDMKSPRDREGLRRVLLELEAEFRVPRAVSTWKLDHGLQLQGLDLSGTLSSLSRYR